MMQPPPMGTEENPLQAGAEAGQGAPRFLSGAALGDLTRGLSGIRTSTTGNVSDLMQVLPKNQATRALADQRGASAALNREQTRYVGPQARANIAQSYASANSSNASANSSNASADQTRFEIGQAQRFEPLEIQQRLAEMGKTATGVQRQQIGALSQEITSLVQYGVANGLIDKKTGSLSQQNTPQGKTASAQLQNRLKQAAASMASLNAQIPGSTGSVPQSPGIRGALSPAEWAKSRQRR
jgi:hypothetical protein